MDVLGAMLNLAGINPTDEDKKRIVAGIEFIARSPEEFARVEEKLDRVESKLDMIIKHLEIDANGG